MLSERDHSHDQGDYKRDRNPGRKLTPG